MDLEKLARIVGAREGDRSEGAVVKDAVGRDAEAFGFAGAPFFEASGEGFSIGRKSKWDRRLPAGPRDLRGDAI